MADELFSDDHNTELPALDDLVGEGKKYGDTKALVAAMLEKDRFIGQLQGENEELRVDLRSRTAVEELLDKLPKQSLSEELQNKPDLGSDANLSVEEITKRVLENIESQSAADRRTQNMKRAKDLLREKFGNEFEPRLREIAKELGVSVKYLDDIAGTSPDGLLRIIDSVSGSAPAHKPSAPPNSSIDLQKSTFQAGQKKTRSYFRELRKSDPNLYYSPKVQNEMHKLATELGSAFFD